MSLYDPLGTFGEIERILYIGGVVSGGTPLIIIIIILTTFNLQPKYK